jgi:hypothetical protein
LPIARDLTTVGRLVMHAELARYDDLVHAVYDVALEPAKKFTVTLSAPTGATLGTRSTVTVTTRAN